MVFYDGKYRAFDAPKRLNLDDFSANEKKVWRMDQQTIQLTDFAQIGP